MVMLTKTRTRVSEQMGQMEFKDNRMEIERVNNKKLLEEIKYIVGKLDISQRHIRSLQEGDLYNPHGIQECISASKILLEAFHTPFSPGITELRAIQDQRQEITRLKSEFAQRFYLHLDKFISQHSNIELVSYKMSNELCIPPHDDVHEDFQPYVELMKWLKELDNAKYLEIKTHYESSFSKTYEKEFGEYLSYAKMKGSRKVKGSKSGPSLLSVSTSDHHKQSKSSLYRAFKKEGKLKRSGSMESIDSMVSQESSTSSAIMGGGNVTQFDQVFDVILSELEPYISAEQEFCTSFFHLRYPGDEQEKDSTDGGMISRARPEHL